MSGSYEELANAIILKAVKDWREAATKLKKRPRYQSAVKMKKDCEEFFVSEWFGHLTEVNGSYLLRKLKEEEGINDE